MTDPSPYEQGFRDALLTIRAAIDAAPYGRDEYSGCDSAVLEIAEKRIAELIDQKNHDLWNLLAIAQVDTLPPDHEAHALRIMLRAPSGLLIDSEGRVLFIRLNGTEYDTGVLSLLEEKAKREAAIALMNPPEPETIPIRVNGRGHHVEPSVALTYSDLLALAELAATRSSLAP